MSKKLLLADDSITIQKVIQITFAHEDYELTITDNGDAALTKAQELRPDLVMADIYMPGKNGYELTAAIKQDPALQHVPVLLLAGSFEPFDEDKARSCRADAWIEKPFESQSLIDKVAELLSAAQQAPAAPTPVAEPAPFAAVEPVAVEKTLVEEMPLAAFDEPVSADPEMAAASDDPFGDISFEEETPIVEPEPVSAADDWSDVAAEPAVEESVFEESVFEESVFEESAFEELAIEELAIEDTFAVADETIVDIADDFSFAEEEPVATEESLVSDIDLDVLEMAEEDIMPLDDDDILGAEDLEPAMPEQTLAAWSRTATGAEDVFADSFEETHDFDSEPALVAPVDAPVFAEEAPLVVDDEPVAEAYSAFEEPDAEIVPEEQPVSVVNEHPSPVYEEPEPTATAVAMVDVEAQAAAMSTEDVEKIIEKVVTQVVEKLAGTILERVAWDVVPDLAENLIREEIRKIKDAAA